MKPFSIVASLLLALALPVPALAIGLQLMPSTAHVSLGDTLSVDVAVSGLGSGVAPSVGAIDLHVGFDASLLLPIGVDFGPYLGSSAEALFGFDISVPGRVDFAALSLLAPGDLDALQPANFRLATLSFSALASGSATLALVGEMRVDDAFGLKLPVPEPATSWLLAIGLAICAARAARRTRRRPSSRT